MPFDVLASAGPISTREKYSMYKTALRNDISSDNDRIAVAHLPKSNSLTFYSRDELGEIILDSPADSNPENNEFMTIQRAVAKALGLIPPHDDEIDGVLNYNMAIPADLALSLGDFERFDGIGSGQYDILGLLEHEIAHAMGFSGGYYDHDDNLIVSPYVLFRYDGNMQGQNTEFSIMNPLPVENPYFSIDGGVTQLALFHGSHWESAVELINGVDVETTPYGVMNWTGPVGHSNRISKLDLLYFDVIGFDLRPTIKPGQIKLGVKSNGGIFSGELTAKSVAHNESVSIIPDYIVQRSSDLKNWTGLGGRNQGGLVQSFEGRFEAEMDSPDLQIFRVVGTVNLPGAELSSLNLEGAILEGANLENAILVGSDLRESNLDRSNLKGANLTRAALHFASLKSADLSNCNLTSANLFGADLEGTILEGVVFENTVMPDGSIMNRTMLATP